SRRSRVISLGSRRSMSRVRTLLQLLQQQQYNFKPRRLELPTPDADRQLGPKLDRRLLTMLREIPVTITRHLDTVRFEFAEPLAVLMFLVTPLEEEAVWSLSPGGMEQAKASGAFAAIPLEDIEPAALLLASEPTSWVDPDVARVQAINY